MRVIVEEDTSLDEPAQLYRWKAGCSCPICIGNDGAVRAKGLPFPSGHTKAPAHEGCKCACTPLMQEGMVLNDLDELVEFNPYHGQHGRFASGPGGSGDASGGGNGFDQLSLEQKDAYMQQQGAAWRQSLSRQENRAIDQYLSPGYKGMQDTLRFGTYNDMSPEEFAAFAREEPQVAAMIKSQMDGYTTNAANALLRGATPTEMTVNRWVSADMFPAFQANAGKHFVDRGFVSTTLGELPDTVQGETLMHIHLPQGTPGGYTAALADSPTYEWTIPPNAKLHIDQAYVDAQGSKHVMLTYVGQHQWGG